MQTQDRRVAPRLVTITGTDGKTSTVNFVHDLLSALGQRVVSRSSIGVRRGHEEPVVDDLPPGAIGLAVFLAEQAADLVDFVVLEAPSRALAAGCFDEASPSVAALTTLGRDHLDGHGSFEAYVRAKSRLFERLSAPSRVVLPRRSPHQAALDRIAERARSAVASVYQADITDLTIEDRGGDRASIAFGGATATLEFSTRWLVHDWWIAARAVHALGFPIDDVFSAATHCRPPPGRMDRRRWTAGSLVIVDLAHTPEALDTVTRELRGRTPGELIVVFGAGGDRDRGKRSRMGAAVHRWSDHAIVTDDNPRHEDPAAIRRELLAACPGAREVPDRARAIASGAAMLRPGDTLLIAGRGHELHQATASGHRTLCDSAVLDRLLQPEE